MKIQDIPKELRPREKALLNGVESLTEAELLALIIGSGSRGHNVLEVAQNLLEQNGGLTQLSKKTFAVLTREKSVSEARAFSLLAVFEIAKRIAQSKPYKDSMSISEIYEHYKVKLCSFEDEHTYILIFNRAKKLIRETLLSKGKETQNVPSKEQVINELLGVNGTGFILLHNHPSGICLPSPGDMAFVRALEECTRGTKFMLIDNVIMSDEGYYSFKENSLII